ncbi:hypothetical protein MMC26_000228 [Xylographa opegraphella]|nr:hypothetical protein [Xylographa opegraphella]
MHLILTGATGLVGSACLQQMLMEKRVTKISILSRRPVPMASGHAKVQVIPHKDFSAYEPDVLAKLEGAEGCVWALGTSSNNVSRSEYTEITVDYPLVAAKAFKGLSSPFKFVYVSGEGATSRPGKLTPYYGVVKGRAEVALLKLHEDNPDFRPFSVRPAVVDPSAHPEIRSFIPKLPLWQSTLSAGLVPVLNGIWKNGVSPTADLGRYLTELAMGDGEMLQGDGVDGDGRIVNNRAFRRLAGI